MFDHESNLILRWLNALADDQREMLARRYTRRLGMSQTYAPRRNDDPVHALGTMLFKDCAQSLGLSPQELRGLLHSPRRHVMESIAWLALQQIQTSRVDSPHQRDDEDMEVADQNWDELPERIIRRMNNLPLE